MNTLKMILAMLMCWLVSRTGQYSSKVGKSREAERSMNTLKLVLAMLMCWLVSRTGQYSSKEEVAALVKSFSIEPKGKKNE